MRPGELRADRCRADAVLRLRDSADRLLLALALLLPLDADARDLLLRELLPRDLLLEDEDFVMRVDGREDLRRALLLDFCAMDSPFLLLCDELAPFAGCQSHKRIIRRAHTNQEQTTAA